MSRLLALAILSLALGASAAERDEPRAAARVEHSLGADRFVAGGSALVTRPVPGDLIAAGGELDVLASVGGDMVVAGGNVRIDGATGQDLYAAGGHVGLDAPVARNARIAGGSVRIGPRAHITGGATISGGEVNVLAGVESYLQVAAGRVFIDAPIGGDVEAAGEEIELGPNARIAGRLRYASRREPIRHADAQVRGGLERIPLPRVEIEEVPWRGVARTAFWIWTAGLMILGVVLVAGFPDTASRVAETACRRPGWSLVMGFVGLVVIPSAALVIAITGIGVPLALLAGLAYLGLLLVGYVAAGIALGAAVSQRWGGARAQATAWRAAAAAAAILVLCVIVRVPYAGALVALLALLIGMGAILLQFRRGARQA